MNETMADDVGKKTYDMPPASSDDASSTSSNLLTLLLSSWSYSNKTTIVGSAILAVVTLCYFVVWRSSNMPRAIRHHWGRFKFVANIGRGVLNSYIHKVEPDNPMHGGDLVAKCLKGHNITHIFTLSGGHISPILVACENAGIRVIDTRHEVNAVFAADAVARLSGNLGVAVVTAGPGVTNTITAAKNAQMAQSPVLIIGGAAATLTKGQGSLQDIDQLSLLKSICKRTFSVKRVRDIVPCVTEAAQIACSMTPGPVFIEMPIDCLYPYKLIKEFVTPKAPPKTTGQQLLNWGLDRYAQGLVAGGFENWSYERKEIDFHPAQPRHIIANVTFLKRRKRPLFIVGSQAVRDPRLVPGLRESLKKMRVPTYLTGMARGLLGEECDFVMRQCRREALKEADFISLFGVPVDFRLNYGRDFKKDQFITIINYDQEQMWLNVGVTYKPKHLFWGDPGSFLYYMAEEMRRWHVKVDEEWIQRLNEKQSVREAEIVKQSREVPEQHLNPVRVLRILNECLGERSILVADGGDFVGTAAYTLRPRAPLSWLDPGPFGTLGVGGGFALGAKLMRPDDEVWLIWGDGSAGYSVMEFDSMKRHKAPCIALIGNDACWAQIERDQTALLGKPTACLLDYSAYEKIADAFGNVGLQMTGDMSDEQIRDVFMKAKELNKRGASVIINALIGKSEFRKGSISM